MALPTTGPISFNDIQNELGGSNPIAMTEYYGIDTLPTENTISMQNFRGVSGYTPISNVQISGGGGSSNYCTDNANSCYASASDSWTVTYNGGDPATDVFTWIKHSGGTPSLFGESTATLSISFGGNFDAGQGDNITCRYKCTVSNPTNGDSGIMSGPGVSSTLIIGNDGDPECFSWDTPIWMNDGSFKNAGDINIGDKLKAFITPSMIPEEQEGWEDWTNTNLTGGALEKTDVIRASSHVTPNYYKINNDLKVTASHPFLIYRNSIWQWINAQDLVVGDLFYGQDGSNIPVNSLVFVDLPIQVINIGVEPADTYFAGSLNGIAVLGHNK